MQLSLELVRNLLRETFGRESFIAGFVKRMEANPDCPTAAISADGSLEYGPDFVKQYVDSKQDLFCLIVHELMHRMFGHFVYGGGQLENIAADMIINACISRGFRTHSGHGSLFRRFYANTGLPGLLRPESRMRDSRFGGLYATVYGTETTTGTRISTGEVIQSLRVLMPEGEQQPVMLLGSHGQEKGRQSPGQFSTELISHLAEDLKRLAKESCSTAGKNDWLYAELVEVLEGHISLRRSVLDRFASKRALENFLGNAQTFKCAVSPVPISLSKRDAVLLAAGAYPIHFHRQASSIARTKQGLAIYLDVSGSVNAHLPKIIGMLQSLRQELMTVFLFSNKVVEIPMAEVLKGHVRTTYGTDFNCIAESLMERGVDKAIVITDGYASLNNALAGELKRQGVHLLTVLFGGKTGCPELEQFGEVVALEEVCPRRFEART